MKNFQAPPAAEAITKDIKHSYMGTWCTKKRAQSDAVMVVKWYIPKRDPTARVSTVTACNESMK